MKKRKNYLIDKKFQFRATFIIIGLSTAIISVIIIFISIIAVFNNTKIKEIIGAEDNIVQFLATKPDNVDTRYYNDVLKDIAKKHNTNTKDMNDIIFNNQILLMVTLLIALLGECLLSMKLIRLTHRISGPIYVMSNYIRSIIDGKKPEIRNLRKDDELQEFHRLFKEMVDTMEKGKK
ncbi:MAG: hypothetical protein KA369_01860 [Spirochaetes bacterium]|jgi:signal transduction histidine kinase|nr:hypothetical protein [Spirochaetota bacterium]